jgi:hypothetical protein
VSVTCGIVESAVKRHNPKVMQTNKADSDIVHQLKLSYTWMGNIGRYYIHNEDKLISEMYIHVVQCM